MYCIVKAETSTKLCGICGLYPKRWKWHYRNYIIWSKFSFRTRRAPSPFPGIDKQQAPAVRRTSKSSASSFLPTDVLQSSIGDNLFSGKMEMHCNAVQNNGRSFALGKNPLRVAPTFIKKQRSRTQTSLHNSTKHTTQAGTHPRTHAPTHLHTAS